MIHVVNPIMKPPFLMVCYWVYPFTTLVEVPEIIQTWTFLILIYFDMVLKHIKTYCSHVQLKNRIVQTFAPSWMPVRDPLTPSRVALFCAGHAAIHGKSVLHFGNDTWSVVPNLKSSSLDGSTDLLWKWGVKLDCSGMAPEKTNRTNAVIGVISTCNRTT